MFRSRTGRRGRWLSGLTAALVAVGGVPLLLTGNAYADSAPVPPVTISTVTADSLPTVQINGVVWDQVIVGNTVYATGNFTSARPAGAASGTNETPRSNILAYNLTTGVLNTTWAPTLNGQGLAIIASADGTRIFVAGEFTSVSGISRSRIVALDAATGSVITSFNPNPNTRVRALAVNGDTLYMGGAFTTVGGQTRNRLAAVSATTGALSTWAPSVDNEVFAVTAPPNTGNVIAGGRFQFSNGTETDGLGNFDATSGATLPWQAYGVFPNHGPNSAIESLHNQNGVVYGTAYDFGGGSPFENSFAADAVTGAVSWVNGCKGDTYDAAPIGNVLYTVGHAHDCSALGAWPDANPRNFQRALATSLGPDADGSFNVAGSYTAYHKPELLQWLPTLAAGTFTGQTQAAWTIEGNSNYVALGGEFPTVNGVAQQGLTRFAVKTIAPNLQGGQGFPGLTPKLVPLAPGAERISWTAAWDRDNRNLTYEVLRGATTNTSTVIGTLTADSTWWSLPALAFTDTTAPPGSSQTYRIREKDAFNNTLVSTATTGTVASGTASSSTYGNAVRADGATDYWRLDEASGTTSYNWIGGDDLTIDSSATRGTAGAFNGDSDTSTTFSGAATVPGVSTNVRTGPNTFSTEAWIKTNTTSGGKIIGFGNSNTGDSGGYDRHVYMTNNGRIAFGVYPNQVKLIESTTAYNDNNWHHVVASLGASGMNLYVDGRRVARDPSTTSAQGYSGYWRLGGDNLNGWPDQPSNNKFAGAIDEAAVYPTELSADRVQAHFTAGGGTVASGTRPTDTYGQAVYDAQPDLYWRLNDAAGSPTVADITVNAASGTPVGGPTFGVGGVTAIPGTAAQFNGSNNMISTSASVSNPTVYSEELWFNTTTTSGGKLIGFGDNPTGLSGNYDRHVWMYNDGRLAFGAYTGQTNVAESTAAYNDGKWHHMVATQGSDGMKLYVDGAQVGTNPQTGNQSYTGYWKVGGDVTWGGASSNYFAGTIDDVAVYSSVLTAAQVTDHYTKGGGTVTTPNNPPTAAFTSQVTNLAATFDGSTSADTDGTIAGYSWDFGDNTAAGTGATPTHTYATTGTFTVALTVTDDKGATGTVSHPVTTTAAPVNNPPTAAFTSQVTNLAATFDGSTSADTDGTIAGYSWDFGDNTAAGTGATPTHTYATAGTFTVALTVTDDKGATGTVSHTVTTTAPVTTYASDAFSRTLTSGWGTADTGGAWTVTGGPATDYTVTGGVGKLRAPAASAQRTAYLGSIAQTDTEVNTTVSLDQAGTGGGTYVQVIGRRVGTTGDYRMKVRFVAGGGVSLLLSRTVGTTETTLATATVAGLTYTPGQVLRIRLQVAGNGTTQLKGQVWADGTTQPAAWQVTASDTTASLQAPGSPGVILYLSGTSTAVPVNASIDNFTAGPSQVQ